jgi:hypothetical protein
VCRFCAVRCLIIIYISSLFSNYSTFVFLILFVSLLSCFVCLFFVVCILRFCIVSPFVYSSLFTIFVQVYRPLPPGGNPIAVNKCHISYHIIYIILCHVSCHISNIVSYIILVSYHIISYIISYHIVSYRIISYIIYTG